MTEFERIVLEELSHIRSALDEIRQLIRETLQPEAVAGPGLDE